MVLLSRGYPLRAYKDNRMGVSVLSFSVRGDRVLTIFTRCQQTQGFSEENKLQVNLL